MQPPHPQSMLPCRRTLRRSRPRRHNGYGRALHLSSVGSPEYFSCFQSHQCGIEAQCAYRTVGAVFNDHLGLRIFLDRRLFGSQAGGTIVGPFGGNGWPAGYMRPNFREESRNCIKSDRGASRMRRRGRGHGLHNRWLRAKSASHEIVFQACAADGSSLG